MEIDRNLHIIKSTGKGVFFNPYFLYIFLRKQPFFVNVFHTFYLQIATGFGMGEQGMQLVPFTKISINQGPDEVSGGDPALRELNYFSGKENSD